MKSEEKYFNFPVNLLKGFLEEDFEQENNYHLNRILSFCIYEFSMNLEYNSELSKFKYACKELELDITYPESLLKIGKNLYEYYDYYREPKTGINTKVFWDYYKNEKTEFEKVCLLAHLALKSNTYKKPYTKMDKFYIYSRMDGEVTSIASEFKKFKNKMYFPNQKILDKLSPEMKRYATHRKWDKIRRELEDKWHWFIPKQIPKINDKGVMELKQIRTVNYFTQLPQKDFFKTIINEEKKKFDLRVKKTKSTIVNSLIDEFNSAN